MAVVLDSIHLIRSQCLDGGKRADQDLHSSIDLSKVSIGHHLRWLVADTNLETSWAPVDELDSAFGLERSNSNVYILWYDVTTVEQAGSHVFPVARITLHHLVVGLEA